MLFSRAQEGCERCRRRHERGGDALKSCMSSDTLKTCTVLEFPAVSRTSSASGKSVLQSFVPAARPHIHDESSHKLI